ncbi:MAG TPA: phage holin family protein [Steroidobacteraceae bacterium]|nr:phage holin family protein [Steroidobacteraceae bacterium]
MSAEDPARHGLVGNLFQSVGNLLATALAIVRTRLELVSTELQEEVQRAAEALTWAFIALFAAGIGLFMAGLTVILAFWETQRVLAATLVTAFFFLLAIIAGLVLRGRMRARPRPLAGTLEELARDVDRLERRQ